MDTLSIYQDQNTLWHDEPCRNGKPASNNWMKYSSIARIFGLHINYELMEAYYDKCKVKVEKNYIRIDRHPGKVDPPISQEEMVGLLILGLIRYKDLKDNHFVFYKKGEPVNKKTIKKILEGVVELGMRGVLERLLPFTKKTNSARNKFWKYKVENLYQAAFRMNPGIVYMLKKANGATIHKEDKELFKLYRDSVLSKKSNSTGNISQKNLLWILAVYANDKKLARKCNPKKNIPLYFGKDHPFSHAVKTSPWA